MTAEAQERAAARGAYLRDHPSDGPEDRTLGDRCLHFAAPSMGSGYNSYLQILQTPDPRGHPAGDGATRSAPFRSTAGSHAGIPQWNGDARGRWEGDTLVVETMDYSPQARFSGATEKLHLVERFTRGSVPTCCGTRSR